MYCVCVCVDWLVAQKSHGEPSSVHQLFTLSFGGLRSSHTIRLGLCPKQEQTLGHQHLCQFSTYSYIRLSQFHDLCLLVLVVIDYLIFSHVHLGLPGNQRHWQYSSTLELSTITAHFTTLEYLVNLLDISVLWIMSFVLIYVYN